MPIAPEDELLCSADDPAGARPPIPSEPAVTPIVQTSLFSFGSFGELVSALSAEHRHHVYTRGRNPTVEAVERKLAALERGAACLCFASGMAAISAVMLGLLGSGDHVLFVNQTYGPTLELATHLRRFGVTHDLVLDLDPESVAAALRPNTKLVWLESPGTMLFRTLDIGAIARLARERGVLTCIDNSWATPLFQKPIEHGVDIVVHTASKYLAGHSDLMAGAVISTAARIEELFYRALLLNGGSLAPFDAWLLLRGLRTLPVRMRQHETNGLHVARFLAGHPAVAKVHHPGLGSGDAHSGGARSGTPRSGTPRSGASPGKGSLCGYSGLFSFELADASFEAVSHVIDRLRRFRIGVSWGGTESLVISPERGPDASHLEAQRLPRGLIRIAVGLEGADALIEDLDQALGS